MDSFSTQTSKEVTDMEKLKTIQLNVTISREDHDLLVKLAAERNLKDPSAGATKGGIGREILMEYLENVRKERRDMS